MKTTITENIQHELPVSRETDVAVVGAGIAGVAAALAAARTGADTTLIEKEYGLGGMATLGLITIYLPLDDGEGHQVCYGIVEELFRLSISMGAEADYPTAWLENGTTEEKLHTRFKVRYNPHLFSLLAEKLLLDHGVHILYGTSVCAVKKSENKISHVIIENKSGRSAVEIKTIVDCSGDADVCAQAGAPTYVNPAGNGLASWYYYHKDGKVELNMFGLADVVPTDSEDKEKNAKTDSIGNTRFSGIDGEELSTAVVEAHRAMFNNILKNREDHPDFMPVTVSSIPLVRMSRRICGEYEMTGADDRKRKEDSIGMTGDWTKRGPVYEIPFSALYSAKIPNLITAGRIISTDHDIWNVTRVIPPSAVSGQAAGTAAAMFDDFTKADVRKLQEQLIADGVKLHYDELV